MKIENIVTREEYEKTTKVTYDQFCDLATRLIKMAVEESLRALPPVMTHISNQVAYLKELSDSFYKDNKDLIPHKRLVSRVIEELEGKNPGKSYEQIQKLAALEARNRILLLTKADLTTEGKPRVLSVVDSKLKELK